MVLRRKTCITRFDLVALVRELSSVVVGARVTNLYQVGEVLYLKLRCRDGVTRFLVSDGMRISLTSYLPQEWPQQPPGFCTLLRRFLRSGVVTSLHQPSLDRVLEVRIRQGSTEWVLTLEYAQRYNVVLRSSEGVVRAVLHSAEYRDRILRVGEVYRYPPLFPHLLNLEFEDFRKYLEKCPDLEVVRALVRTLGLPGEVAEELCYRAGIEKRRRVSEVPVPDLENLWSELRTFTEELLQGSLSPRIYFLEERPVTVVPTPLEYLEELGLEYRTYETFNEAVDHYFTPLLREKWSEYTRRVAWSEVEKLRKVVEKVRCEVEEFRSREERVRRLAEYLAQRLHELQVLRNLVLEKRFRTSPDDLNTELWSYGVRSLLIRELRPEQRSVVVEVPDLTLSFEYYVTETPGQLLTRLYERARELHQKYVSALEKLRELEQRLEEVRERAEVQVREVEESLEYVPEVRVEWFEKFRWFLTSEDLLVLGGRDAHQNEVLVRRYLTERDLFLHADIHGGSVVVLKWGREEEPPSTSVWEAAQFAAVYSRAWVQGYHVVDVYWVWGHQVSKSAPPGEYLPRGAFMVYGRRNYLRNVPLELAVGFIRYGEELKLTAGPPTAVVRRAHCYAVLSPGRTPKMEVVKRLAETFLRTLPEYLRRLYRRNLVDKLAQLVPGEYVELREVSTP